MPHHHFKLSKNHLDEYLTKKEKKPFKITFTHFFKKDVVDIFEKKDLLKNPFSPKALEENKLKTTFTLFKKKVENDEKHLKNQLIKEENKITQRAEKMEKIQSNFKVELKKLDKPEGLDNPFKEIKNTIEPHTNNSIDKTYKEPVYIPTHNVEEQNINSLQKLSINETLEKQTIFRYKLNTGFSKVLLFQN